MGIFSFICVCHSDRSLAGGVGVQKILELVPTHQWVKPGPGSSAGPLMGIAGSRGLAAGNKGPRTRTESPMGKSSS